MRCPNAVGYTALQATEQFEAGMSVMSINGESCYGKTRKEVGALVKAASGGTLAVGVQRVVHSDLALAHGDITDHIAEHIIEHATGQVTGRVTEQVTEHATEQVTGRVKEQVTEHATEQVTEQATDATDHVTDHVTDHGTDHVTDHVTAQVTEHVNEHVTEQATDEVQRPLDLEPEQQVLGTSVIGCINSHCCCSSARCVHAKHTSAYSMPPIFRCI